MHGLDVVLWMGILAHELSKCPLSLQDLQVSTFLEEGNIDHTAHFFGAIIGMLWAALVLLCSLESVRPRWLSFGGWCWYLSFGGWSDVGKLGTGFRRCKRRQRFSDGNMHL
jgi:hypothetical protein